MKKLFLFLALTITSLHAQSPLIPAPVSYKPSQGTYILKSGTAVSISANSNELKAVADQLIKHPVLKSLNLVMKEGESNNITLTMLVTPNTTIGNEGYTLSVRPDQINIAANTTAGLFYGIQSFAQLLPADKANLNIPSCDIVDYPRFGWRGLMLDVSRHFFSVNDVKQYIDAMAIYKFNTLHIHLTDDNGWRVEIKSLPKLTSVGAWRAERSGTFGDRTPVKEGEPATYGGFYTQDQIKDLVRYALAKHITILPEIDVPGHSMAMLAAYPELSCTHEKVYVNPGTNFAEWYGNGKFKMLVDNTLNPANEKVYEYLDKIFTELATLFPNPYIHVGGDECYHGYWEANAEVKELMAKEKLKDAMEVQSYFIQRLEKILKSKGKKLIGWDEILEGGLGKESTVMSWRGTKGGTEAAKLGHEVVMTPSQFTYIDFMQGDKALEFPVYSSLTLKKTYSFEPVPDSINPKFILGGQANLWSEKIPTMRHAFYMTYPRASAIAEDLWSPKTAKNWNGFTTRVENQFKLFDQLQWNISRSLYDASATAAKQGDKLMCTLTSELPDAEIHYTTDNTFPDQFSPKYSTPFNVPDGDVTLRFVTTRKGKVIGRMVTIPRKDLAARVK